MAERAVYPGSAEFVGGDEVRDLRCYCTNVVIEGKTSLENAKAALAEHLQDSRAHGAEFADATAEDLRFESPAEGGRTSIQWVRGNRSG